nr:hypothetical protein [Pandoravirus aubagnensis]
MDLADTRAHIIEWYLRLGLAQHDHVQSKLAWLADHWYLAVDAEFARQAQRAYQRLVASDILIEWRPRSWAAARVTVVIAAAPHDLLALVPAVVGRGWKPSERPCALVVLDDWNPRWWTQWSVSTVAGRLEACAPAFVSVQGHDNVVLDAREASVAKVRDALNDMCALTRVVIVRDRSDVPLDGVDAVVCACACRQASESHLHAVDRYRARVFYTRRSTRPMAIAFAPWTGADRNNNNSSDHIASAGDDHGADGANGPRPGHYIDPCVYEGVGPRGVPVPMRDCASLDCGCCLSFDPAWVETRERCPFVGGCASCD